MNFFAWLVGKITSYVLGLLGRGSSLPGKIGLALDSQFLKAFKWPETIIFVTGTNGKTTTTHYLVEMLRADGHSVLTNAEGANMIQGLATQLIRETGITRELAADFAVFEVDEGSLFKIMSQIVPNDLVMTNLFPDQEDRFGSADQLMRYLNSIIPPQPKPRLILNGQDPRLVWIGQNHPENNPLYYGSAPQDFEEPTHTIACPNCGKELAYDVPFYEQIGNFHCEHCGFKTPPLTDCSEDVKLSEKTFQLDGESYTLPQANIYTLYNTLAALSAARTVGTSPTAIQQALRQDFHVKGRADIIRLGEKEILATIAKNPASFNQSLMQVKREADTESYTLLLSVNKAPADGTNPSWVERCRFDTLADCPPDRFIITGAARKTVKDVLLTQGFTDEQLTLLDPEDALKHLEQSPHSGYIIANYTALFELYQLLP